MVYVENRFIGESSRLIAGIIVITYIISKEGRLVTMNIEKPFGSFDHTFVISVLKNLILVTILLVGLKPFSQNKSLA